MEIFADTADINELKEVISLGIIDGCTTNPIILAKAGNKDYKKQLKEILMLINGPVSVEVTTNDKDEMIKQGREFAALAKNVVIKLPISNEGLKALKVLREEGIKTNVTGGMSARQAVIAAKAQATYVSLLWARIEDMGYDAFREVKNAADIIRLHNLKTKIIVGSFRQLSHINQAFLSGAHVLTIPTDILLKIAWNPRSESTIQEFLDKWNSFTANQ